MKSDFDDLRIFSGTAHKGLATDIADHLQMSLGQITVQAFPDGETFVKINENIRGRDVFIVQPTSPPTNHNLMELLIMIDAARRASAARITAVVPFYGYARQDRKDQPRVPITAKLVANLLVASGATRVLTMDLHAQQIQGFFDIPVDHLYSAPVFFHHLIERNIENAVVVCPDIGSVRQASVYAETLNAGLAIVAKRRLSATEVEATHVIGDVSDKHVVLVDDLTETAGTLTRAATLLHQQGAKSILACVSHSVLNEMAVERLKESPIDELITTDSTPQTVRLVDTAQTILSVAPLLGDAIHRIHCGESVTSLFDVKAKRS